MAQDRRFFGRAWASLASTHNAFGKLCLLALLQVVPILGQMIALGYFLGWVREAAWDLESPLGAHVCGGSDRGFWPRAAKAWCVEALYGIIIVAVDAVVCLAFMFGTRGLDRLGESVLVGVGSAVLVVVDVMLLICMYVGLVRLAVYGRFGAAWQWGKSLKMACHDFGGLLKVAFGSLGLRLIVCLLAFVVCVSAALTLMPGVASALLGLGAGLGGLGDSAASLGLLAQVPSFLVAMLPAVAVLSFPLSVLCTLVSAVSWRALGNWAAGFEVARWGDMHAPLPFERDARRPGSVSESTTPDVREAVGAADEGAASDSTPNPEADVEPESAAESVETSGGPTPAPSGSRDSGSETGSRSSTAASAPEPCASAAAHAADPPAASRPLRRSRPVLATVLCIAVSLVVCVVVGTLASCVVRASSDVVGSMLATGGSPAGTSGQTSHDVEGTWTLEDGSTLTLNFDRTFTLSYADGSEVAGTYVESLATSDELSALDFDVSVWDDLLLGVEAYHVVMTASTGTDSSGADASAKVRGQDVDVVFAITHGWDGVDRATVYSADDPDSHQDASRV